VRRLAAGSLAIILAAFAAAAPQKGPPASKSAQGGNVYKAWVKSVAWIVTHDGTSPRIGTGTGSLIDLQDRLVITNYHVVKDFENVYVFFPQFDQGTIRNDRQAYITQVRNRTAPKGKVVAREPKRDLAVIKLDALPKGTPAIRLAKDPVSPSDRIHCIGNPGVSGGLWAYTPGDVKNVAPMKMKTRSRGGDGDGFEVRARMIENTAPTNEGDSGGPVLNDAGELVGVTQGYAVVENARGIFSYAVDLSEVKDFLKANRFLRPLMPPPPTMVTAADTAKDTAPADPKAEAERKEAAAAAKLGFAKDLIASGKKDRARERLREVTKEYPGTKAAAEAAQLIETLK
jgi:S1-C subfamily serine protease